jgi:hypothetical protein
VGERCLNGKALAREGRYVGEGQRCAGTAVDAPTVVGKGNITVLFFEKPRHAEGGAEEACWARSLGRPGNEPFG